jgi:hypothetical protein
LLARQVEVERSGNVDAVRADEEPERRGDTGIDIQELVLPVARVIPVAHVDDARYPIAFIKRSVVASTTSLEAHTPRVVIPV